MAFGEAGNGLELRQPWLDTAARVFKMIYSDQSAVSSPAPPSMKRPPYQ
jgi:hypothetical protein